MTSEQDQSPSDETANLPDGAAPTEPSDAIDSEAKPHRGFILGESLLGEDEL